jgi:hypothetical protein
VLLAVTAAALVGGSQAPPVGAFGVPSAHAPQTTQQGPRPGPHSRTLEPKAQHGDDIAWVVSAVAGGLGLGAAVALIARRPRPADSAGRTLPANPTR